MVFHAFVFCQVFNEINARKLHNELNVFKGITVHPWFLAVFFGTIGVQYALIEVPGTVSWRPRIYSISSSLTYSISPALLPSLPPSGLFMVSE